MEVRFKKLNGIAIIPSKAHATDAGFDLVATSKKYDEYGNVSYGIGISVEIPSGYVGFIFPRSSVSKQAISLCNCVGVIDSNYRGEIMCKFKPTLNYGDIVIVDGQTTFSNHIKSFSDYNVGDRVAQLIILPYPEIEFIEAEELSDSDRGQGGFGSTGK